MTDYEATALTLVEQLKSKQDQEVYDCLQYHTEKFYKDHRWSKQIIELRKQEKIYFKVKDYINAEKVRQLCQELEKQEIDQI